MQPVTPTPSPASTLPVNPLALKDIHVPEQISNFPISYGWCFLTALVLLVIVISVIKFKNSIQRNKVKKQALTQLNNHLDISNHEVISLLKCAAMHYFSRIEIAKLYGESLQQFLVEQLPNKHQDKFNQLSEQAFINQYQQSFQDNVDNNFQQAAHLWLAQALPPKPAKQKTSNNTESGLIQESEGANT